MVAFEVLFSYDRPLKSLTTIIVILVDYKLFKCFSILASGIRLTTKPFVFTKEQVKQAEKVRLR